MTRLKRNRATNRNRQIALGLFFSLLLLSAHGCGRTKVPITGKFIPPESFAEANETWDRDPDGLTDLDYQQISWFFNTRPELLDSPEWIGQPEKYLLKSSPRRTRYYWFSGSIESPTWNVLESDDSRLRDFDGMGIPGIPPEH